MPKKNKYTGLILGILIIVLLSRCGDKSSPNPEITAINPTAGPVGTIVTIEGSGFGTSAQEDVVVNFNETEAEVSSVEDNQIKTIVPEDATTGAISLMINGVTVSGPAFTIEPSMPGIVAVQPDSGIIGEEVTITGQNFSAVPYENSITFNETPAEIESATETELVTHVPEDATDGPIEVTVDGQTAMYTDFDVITMGTLEVEISTTGTDIDSDGYRLSVLTEGTEIDTSVAVNDTIKLRVEAGSQSIELKDIASGCSLIGPEGNPRGVQLAAGDTSKVTFTVECQNQMVDLEIIPETISAGDNYSCGLDMDGNAYCWGLNNYGQLGDGTTLNQKTPIAVNMPANVSFKTLSAGSEHTVAISSTGQAYAWGRNNYGQIGDGSIGTEVKRYTPVAVTMPAGVSFKQITVGDNFTVALANTGKAYSWGRNDNGLLGNGTNDIYRTTPVEVIMPPNVEFVEMSAASAGAHIVALSSDGKAWSWGNNQYGMLGDGTTNSTNKPVAVTMPEGVLFKSVDAYYLHTVALSTSGKIWTWGENSRGRLGNGAEGSTDTSVPILVTMPSGVTFSAVDAGWTHNVALSTEGEVWGWGGNFYGMVGDGTETDRFIPVAVKMPAGISFSKISAGHHHTLAITDNGNAWAWGRNDYAGTLGDGTMTNSAIPIAVDMSFGVFQTE